MAIINGCILSEEQMEGMVIFNDINIDNLSCHLICEKELSHDQESWTLQIHAGLQFQPLAHESLLFLRLLVENRAIASFQTIQDYSSETISASLMQDRGSSFINKTQLIIPGTFT
ncbi:hypothetical protein Y1Q_0007913 [Alligator mississippiensis]|uniref:Uncharacterized protein n=1 Tax=Alligator mississippiensis TaxID=8496 RepID=A0A151NEU8_ALLMI|nr:hypothetical protein Y1Q_0007913 [Alligator mississippiensis]